MKKSLSILMFAAACSVNAAPAEQSANCYAQVSVSKNAGDLQNVAFNISNQEIGLNRSLTIISGGSPQIIPDLPCVPSPYTISATGYAPFARTAQGIGVCTLTVGEVFMSNTGDNVSVVFPEDFTCSH